MYHVYICSWAFKNACDKAWHEFQFSVLFCFCLKNNVIYCLIFSYGHVGKQIKEHCINSEHGYWYKITELSIESDFSDLVIILAVLDILENTGEYPGHWVPSVPNPLSCSINPQHLRVCFRSKLPTQQNCLHTTIYVNINWQGWMILLDLLSILVSWARSKGEGNIPTSSRSKMNGCVLDSQRTNWLWSS